MTWYRKLGQHEKAIQHYQKAKLNLRQVDYVEGVAHSKLGMAESYFALGDIPAALDLIEYMLPRLQEYKDIEELTRVYLLLSQIHEFQGDEARALNWYKKHGSIRVSPHYFADFI